MPTREAQSKLNRRYLKTAIQHTPEKNKPFWFQDGRGYKIDPHTNGIRRIKEEPPEGYLEEKRKQREKTAKRIGKK